VSNDESATTARRKKRGWRPFRYLRSRPRTVLSLMIFVLVAAALLALNFRPATAVLLAFDLAAIVFLSIMAYMFNKASTAHMRTQAKAMDTGRWGILWSGIVLSTVVLVALSNELHAAKVGGVLALVIGAISVVLSWLFLNTMFAIHYAHGFYGDFGDKHTGLDFPETPHPDYWDFTYFAIVIGMCFQVSDVQVTSRYLRRVVLLHSVIAFFFNVFIIAITVNIVAGQS
jgi:uncharacterized membrane protein